MDRKKFLKSCGFAAVGGVTLSSLLTGCGTASHYAIASYIDNRIVLKKSEFLEPKNAPTGHRSYVLTRTLKAGYQICIYRHSEDEFTALSLQCTHQGCELQPADDYLVCPCHGSEFSNRGAVQQGPAETHLQQWRVTSDNDHIYLHL